jgi:hypothetical protein
LLTNYVFSQFEFSQYVITERTAQAGRSWRASRQSGRNALQSDYDKKLHRMSTQNSERERERAKRERDKGERLWKLALLRKRERERVVVVE